MELIDLSHRLRPGIANPRDQPDLDVTVVTVKTLEKEGVQVLKIGFGNHAGTHIDAPSHIIAGGATAADLPLSRFYGEAVTLDMKKAANEAIDVLDLQNAVPPIRADDMVLLSTGWAARIGTSAYSDDHPYLTPEAATWLVSRGVKLVGIDVSSLECPFSKRPPGFRHETLRILLGAGVPVVHNLAHLDVIAGRRCRVAAFPVGVTGSDAGPARVVAFLD